MKKSIAILVCMMLVIAIILPAAAFSTIAVKAIKLDSEASVRVGQTYKLTVVFTPFNTTQKRLTYAIADKNIATVDATGKITGVKAGNTTITVYSFSNNKIMSKCKLTVLPVSAYPLVSKKATISVFKIAAGPNENMDTNPVTKFYEEKTNVHVKWSTAPGDQFKEKANILLASGEPIDVMFFANWTTARYSINEQYSMGKGGLVIPVSDYLSEAPNLTKALADNNAMRLSATCPDGKMYFIPNLNISYHSFRNPKMFINTTWLQTLGLKSPDTLDDFYNVLKAFKQKDPNGNGLPDEIPLVSFDKAGARADAFLLNAFIYNDSKYNSWLFLNNKGKVDIAVNKAQFQEFLRYMNKLFKEGLYYKESFTLDIPTAIKINEAKKQPVMGAAAADNMFFFSSGAPATTWMDYKILSPLKGADGTRVNATRNYYDGGFAGGLIPSSCKNPTLVMRWIDWFFTQEGALNVCYGLENQGWKKAEAGQTDRDGNPAKIARISLQKTDPLYGNVFWGGNIPCVNKQDFGWAEPTDIYSKVENGAEKALYQWTKTLLVPFEVPKEKVMPPVVPSVANMQEVSQLKTNIETYVKESEARFITGDLDIDKDWNRYLIELYRMGLERFQSLMQRSYMDSSYYTK